MNPILAAPAAVFGAAAIAPRAIDLAAAPLGFLDTLRETVRRTPERAAPPTDAPRQFTAIDSIRHLRRRLEAALASLHEQLQGRFAVENIDVTRPFALRYEADGAVRIEGDHPDADMIRRILTKDVRLSRQAAEIRRLASEVGKTGGDDGEVLLSYAPHRLSIR